MSRVYTSMFHLILEHIIVFTNDSFIIRTETESNLTESNQTELTSDWAHLTPLIMHSRVQYIHYLGKK
jgi:hypothetical protein